MLTNWKRRRQAAVWVKDYIGLQVNQACLCHQCFVHLETLDERVQALKDKCMKNIKSLAVTIGVTLISAQLLKYNTNIHYYEPTTMALTDHNIAISN